MTALMWAVRSQKPEGDDGERDVEEGECKEDGEQIDSEPNSWATLGSRLLNGTWSIEFCATENMKTYLDFWGATFKHPLGGPPIKTPVSLKLNVISQEKIIIKEMNEKKNNGYAEEYEMTMDGVTKTKTPPACLAGANKSRRHSEGFMTAKWVRPGTVVNGEKIEIGIVRTEYMRHLETGQELDFRLYMYRAKSNPTLKMLIEVLDRGSKQVLLTNESMVTRLVTSQ